MSSGTGHKHRHGISKLYSFLGRYMHQQVWDMERRPVRELSMLADTTRQILDDEKAQFNTAQSPD